MRNLLGDVLYALGDADVNVSCINFHCDDTVAETAKDYFEKAFKKEWDATELSHFSDEEEWKEYIEDTSDMYYDGDEEARYPIKVFSTKDGFAAEISSLAMDVTDGVTYYDEPNTLFDALARFQKEYPDIPFEGYVGYMMIDEHGSDVNEFTVSSENGFKYSFSLDTLFPSVGEGLAKALENEDFLENIFDYIEEDEEDEEDDYGTGLNAKDVLKVLSSYSAWLPEDTCEKFIDLAEENGVGNREELEAILSK